MTFLSKFKISLSMAALVLAGGASASDLTSYKPAPRDFLNPPPPPVVQHPVPVPRVEVHVRGGDWGSSIGVRRSHPNGLEYGAQGHFGSNGRPTGGAAVITWPFP